ncbi:MAG: Crp/Fnr family transcriptional regulator [Lachnospiraceae bacterium]|nr:Crp/Fnr family transcriptional regulator [Lachnospiraceae bacterium]
MKVNNGIEHGGCVSRVTANFIKGETILVMGDNNGRVGVLLSGEAHVSTTDVSGHEYILEFLGKDDCFGEYLMMPAVSQLFYVIADSDCSVDFINFKNVLFNCRHNCENHAELVRELLIMTARRAQTLSFHTNILGQHSIREKIMLYLRNQEELLGTSAFTVPMTLSRLANYLSVDRSAMMREIKRMNDEGIIKSSGKEFEILNK